MEVYLSKKIEFKSRLQPSDVLSHISEMIKAPTQEGGYEQALGNRGRIVGWVRESRFEAEEVTRPGHGARLEGYVEPCEEGSRIVGKVTAGLFLRIGFSILAVICAIIWLMCLGDLRNFQMSRLITPFIFTLIFGFVSYLRFSDARRMVELLRDAGEAGEG